MKNKSLSIRLATVLSAAMLGAGLAAGCGNGKVTEPEDTVIDSVDDSEAAGTADVDTDADAGDGENAGSKGTGSTPAVDENDPNFNHGYSISEVGTERRPDEIKRSKDVVIHDSTEAQEYLESCVPSDGSGFTYMLTDTSDDDPGAFMWYEFQLSYGGEIVENTDFTVIAFNDGTIVEGWPEYLTYTVVDNSNALSPDDALQVYAAANGDTRPYVYKQSGYKCVSRKDSVVRYVYTYRYDCGQVLDNITLTLDAETGEMVGFAPDAIS